MAKVFSSRIELEKIAEVLRQYARLPFCKESVPGAVMEGILAHVRGGVTRGTYEFIDVLSTSLKCGWQVKSTLSTTPVTWKRAKIPGAERLIDASKHGEVEEAALGCQELGNAVLDFCNKHCSHSIDTHDLAEVGFSRLIVFPDGQATYYERVIATKHNPVIFEPSEFVWRWSVPKKSEKKEQLPSLHGVHKQSNEKWFACHLLGENQLHFSGERNWWPPLDSPNQITFPLHTALEKMTLEGFAELLSKLVT